MKAKNGKPSQELKCWHGSRDNDSKQITDSEEGFDMRFANNGNFGIGNYFAVSAKYSAQDLFAHKESNGCHGIFQANVLIGEPSVNKVDENRKMPPIKYKNVRYDSVTDN